MNISDIKKKYYSKISPLDLEILISHAIKKSREFILANPSFAISKNQEIKIKLLIKRRIADEPIAYIVGHKEFYGLSFEVNKHTLIPRPETELIVDLLSNTLHNNTIIADIGTGSGNIIISIAKNCHLENIKYFGIDVSEESLSLARKNSKKHKVDRKIKFLRGNLLSPLVDEVESNELIITANLPYLSSEIYNSSPDDVKKYEPKTALYSDYYGLAHYKELLEQASLLVADSALLVTAFFEISPEQKIKIKNIIKNILPNSKIKFHKDLANKWRVCEIKINKL